MHVRPIRVDRKKWVGARGLSLPREAVASNHDSAKKPTVGWETILMKGPKSLE